MDLQTVEQVEQKLQSLSFSKRIRAIPNASDYDPSRTGFISLNQFHRCIEQTYGMRLSEPELALLYRKYKHRHDERIDYKKFQDVIDSIFTEKNLEKDPNKAFTLRPLNENITGVPSLNLPPRIEEHLMNLLSRLHQYYSYNGLDIRTCYRDFDKLSSGYVTVSQFLRNLPAPSDTQNLEKQLLVDKYTNPENGLVNYFKFHSDVTPTSISKGFRMTLPRDSGPAEDGEKGSVQDILGRLQVGYYRSRVRPLDFFRDYDRLHHGTITANQFICGLTLSCSAHDGVKLTRDEMQSLVQAFAGKDGTVKYKEFCDRVDKAFVSGSEADLDKQPALTPPVFRRGDLVQESNALHELDELRLQDVLAGLRQRVVTQRIDTYSVCQDFDRAFGFKKGVTQAQFARLLDSLKLNVLPQDLLLLVAKFSNPTTGFVNYPIFLSKIDPAVRFTEDDQLYYDHTLLQAAPTPAPRLATPSSDYQTPLALIQKRAISQRLRLTEFFKDWDKLNTGFVTPSRFKQGLDRIGAALTPDMITALTAHYTAGPPPNTVSWKQFCLDVDSVFVVPSLERSPTKVIQPLESTYMNLKDQTIGFALLPPEESEEALALIDRIRDFFLGKKCDLEPFWRDFDTHNRGVVSREQFVRGFGLVGMGLTPAQLNVLATKYSRPEGADYRRFLADLFPAYPEISGYTTRMATLKKMEKVSLNDEPTPAQISLDDLLFSIKTKVARDRIRVKEFLEDHDRLNTGRVALSGFTRAMDMCKLELSPKEVDVLASAYLSNKQSGYVDYRRFVRDIESIFTPLDLEKQPTNGNTQPFKAPVGADAAQQTLQLGPDDASALSTLMQQFAAMVRAKRLKYTQAFEDFDRQKRGCVTRAQAKRVFHDLAGTGSWHDHDYDLLFAKYRASLSRSSDEFQFRDFARDIDALVAAMAPGTR